MDDLISRKAALDALAKTMPSPTTHDYCGQFDHDIYIAQETFVDNMQIIAYLPSAERHGRWIDAEPAPFGQMYETCSECGTRQTLDRGKDRFCGVCGAKMDEVTE